MTDLELWQGLREVTPERAVIAREVLDDIRGGTEVMKATRRHPLPGGGYLPKSVLVAVYRRLVEAGEWQADRDLLARIRMKPVRTLSGVTTVTVLTKPYPCPGKCVFCPTDARMPKSYLPDEPGAMRGLQNQFDPYRQVRSRLDALEATGHPTEKIELLILGGTWSAYRRDYQEWFVRRCFAALNDMPEAGDPEPQRVFQSHVKGIGDLVVDQDAHSPDDAVIDNINVNEAVPDALDLTAQHHINEDGHHRCVGLVIETRPDEINPRELAWLRYLGVTKVQMGAQSLDDRVLELNHRGHTTTETLRACTLLRAAGFKVVLHWMPNLLGATIDSDRADFARLFSDGYAPDEIKIYPCQLLANAELYEYWQRGEYQPYTQDELIQLIADIKPGIPVYCRVNRVIRDIPSTNVVAGNRRTSLRMDVFEELARRGQTCRCIRCREIKDEQIDPLTLRLVDTVYPAGGSLAGNSVLTENTLSTGNEMPTAPSETTAPDYVTGSETTEHFLQFVTPDDRIAGYLRLSLPGPACADVTAELPDLTGAALIREVHVYGQSLAVGAEQPGAAQHIGLGLRLLDEASRIARAAGFARLAVISAVGTRLYYERRCFKRGALYLVRDIEAA